MTSDEDYQTQIMQIIGNQNIDNNAKISALTDLINSSINEGNEYADIYYNRAVCYFNFGAYTKAINDVAHIFDIFGTNGDDLNGDEFDAKKDNFAKLYDLLGTCSNQLDNIEAMEYYFNKSLEFDDSKEHQNKISKLKNKTLGNYDTK